MKDRTEGGMHGHTEGSANAQGDGEGWNPEQLRNALEGVPKDRLSEAHRIVGDVTRRTGMNFDETCRNIEHGFQVGTDGGQSRA